MVLVWAVERETEADNPGSDSGSEGEGAEEQVLGRAEVACGGEKYGVACVGGGGGRLFEWG